MNIFENPNEFIGEPRVESMSSSLAEFYEASTALKARLEHSGRLLDDYIANVFSAICRNPNIETAATVGYSRCMKELVKVCGDIVKGDDNHQAHPLYAQVKEFIVAHPLPDGRVINKADVYAGALMKIYGGYALEKFYEEWHNKLISNGYVAKIKVLYNDIIGILGTEEPLEQLNEIIKRTFIIVPATTAFAQGVLHDMLMRFVCQEPETLKYSFSMAMDIVE